jgi:ketosteroid isomerase-like protein
LVRTKIAIPLKGRFGKNRRCQMSTEQVKSRMREFRAALESRDVDKILALFTDDGEWHAPEGVFKGKDQLKRYIAWNAKTTPDLKITETGVKILAEGDAGIYEHVLSGTVDGAKWETLGLCIYEFAGDKVKSIRSAYDRLSIAKQVVKGTMSKMAVNGVLKRMEKGLR